MNKILNIFLIISCILFSFEGYSQEYLSDFNRENRNGETVDNQRSNDALTLPFFDDFSNKGSYPNPEKWQTNSVLVNDGFPILPTNVGAATFDILDEYGKVYSRGSSSPFIGDSLLSKPLNLSHYTPEDSLYLSFTYQPQGNGDAPETNDSLTLWFGYKDATDSLVFRHLWASEGLSLEEFLKDSTGKTFKEVKIPFVDTIFFQEEIYLLFYNYGSLPPAMYATDRSNMDQWSIDFVYLDAHRSYKHDGFRLMSFNAIPTTMLSRYTVMPYRQYKENPTSSIATGIDTYISNLDTVTHQFVQSITAKPLSLESSWTFEQEQDVDFLVADTMKQNHIKLKNFLFPFNNNVDTTSFVVRHVITPVDYQAADGDTVEFVQRFSNYYSYDDGIPERGYGLVPNDAFFAVQFNTYRPDTLSGVSILFNRTLNDANYNFFDLIVWGDNNGKPGSEIYRVTDLRPEWSDDELYKFSYYEFPEDVYVAGLFYVGIMQQESVSINVGFDTSKDNSQYNFYNIGYGWINSSYAGSVMIRPVMSGDVFMTVPENDVVANSVFLYPNPTNDRLNISSEKNISSISLFDMTGRKVLENRGQHSIEVGSLVEGFYFVKVVDEQGSVSTGKCLIIK